MKRAAGFLKERERERKKRKRKKKGRMHDSERKK